MVAASALNAAVEWVDFLARRGQPSQGDLLSQQDFQDLRSVLPALQHHLRQRTLILDSDPIVRHSLDALRTVAVYADKLLGDDSNDESHWEEFDRLRRTTSEVWERARGVGQSGDLRPLRDLVVSMHEFVPWPPDTLRRYVDEYESLRGGADKHGKPVHNG